MRKPEYEDLNEDYNEDEFETNSFRWVSRAIVAVAIIGFISLAWYAFQRGGDSTSLSDIPVVEADSSPVRETPQDPGGWQVPHQDKTVFETIRGNSDQPKPGVAEQLLPEPEKPVDRTAEVPNEIAETSEPIVTPEGPMGGNNTAPVESSTTPEATSEITKEKPTGNTVVGTVTVAESPVPPSGAATTVPAPDTAAAPSASTQAPEIKEAPTVSETKPVAPPPTAETLAKVAPQVQPEKPATPPMKLEPPKAIAAPPRPATTGATGSVKVQLSAVKSEQEAAAEWQRISRKNGDLLASYGHNFQRVDLGAKGIFYRIQVGPLSSEAAKSLCQNLAARKQGCFIVK